MTVSGTKGGKEPSLFFVHAALCLANVNAKYRRPEKRTGCKIDVQSSLQRKTTRKKGCQQGLSEGVKIFKIMYMDRKQ